MSPLLGGWHMRIFLPFFRLFEVFFSRFCKHVEGPGVAVKVQASPDKSVSLVDCRSRPSSLDSVRRFRPSQPRSVIVKRRSPKPSPMSYDTPFSVGTPPLGKTPLRGKRGRSMLPPVCPAKF